MVTRIENDFHKEMIDIYNKAVECGYRPTYFLRMVTDRGGLDAARALLATEEFTSGLKKLWELERLDISMEALVCKSPWSQLFTEEEIEVAKSRLGQLNYTWE